MVKFQIGRIREEGMSRQIPIGVEKRGVDTKEAVFPFIPDHWSDRWELITSELEVARHSLEQAGALCNRLQHFSLRRASLCGEVIPRVEATEPRPSKCRFFQPSQFHLRGFR
jgi:hypothetical protein